MAVNHGSFTIAAEGPQFSLVFYDAVIGTGSWHQQFAGGVDTTFTAPSITANDAAANITAVGSAGQVLFYFATDGTQTWNSVTVAGPGSAG
jgi:hypothetical protein